MLLKLKNVSFRDKLVNYKDDLLEGSLIKLFPYFHWKYFVVKFSPDKMFEWETICQTNMWEFFNQVSLKVFSVR